MSKISGIIVPSAKDEPVKLVEFDQGDVTYIQRVVDGWVQVLDLPQVGATLWCNEEGLIQDLEPNRRASLLSWSNLDIYCRTIPIRGNVLITGQPDDVGRTTTVPAELAELITKTNHFKVEVRAINEETWHGNLMRFTTYWSAAEYGLNLASRWALVEAIRVIAA
ncbi:DUF3846 domain-containing protein [Nocardia sp. NPDC050697]|uniref:DUF3846 domain-containing protein n=1 Tax=Nocardia sp. NPDC050697 TaxID=3155158 RepID=UPI0033C6F462